MGWPAPMASVLLVLVCAQPKNQDLQAGIGYYENGDYAGALNSLKRALEVPSSRPEIAKVHLYIGLIQHKFNLADDAKASFTKALEYDPKVKLPKNAPGAPKKLFKTLQAEHKDKKGPKETIAGGSKSGTKKSRGREPKDGGKEGRGHGAIEPVVASHEAETPVQTKPDGPDESTRAGEPEGSTVSLTSPVASTGSGGGAVQEHSAESGAPTLSLSVTPPVASQDSTANAATTPVTATTNVADDGSSMEVGAWVAVGVAAAAVATGVTFAALASSSGSRALNAPVANDAAALYATAINQRTVAFVSFGVAGLSLGVGALLFALE